MRLDMFDLRETPRGEAFLKVTEDARRAMDRALQAPSSERREASDTAIRKAATAWSTARALLDGIPDALSPLAAALATIYNDNDLTTEAKQRWIDAMAGKVSASIESTSTTILVRLDMVVSILQSAATPPHPGDTAADEARLGNARTDLRMILDALPADPMTLGKRMAQLLGRAITTGDRHTAWILGGTAWPQDYATSRDHSASLDTITRGLDATLGVALDDVNGGDFSRARKAYRVAEDSGYAIRVALGQIPGLIEDVREWAARLGGFR